MFCKKCGENNPENAVYCRNCGAKLIEEEVKKTEVIDNPTGHNYDNQKTTTTGSSSNDSSDAMGCCLCIIAIFIVFAILGMLGF